MVALIGIVVVTFNSAKDILRLLQSLESQSYKKFIIYVVDNNSNDITLNVINRFIEKSTLIINLILNKDNLGYASGNNIGIKASVKDGCEYTLILNPDMELENKCIEFLYDRINSDNKIAGIGPLVLYGNHNINVIQVYGVKANFKTQQKEILFLNQTLDHSIPAEIRVDYVNGGAMMLRNSVLEEIGYFEEKYFMYNDELDLAYRIKKAGYVFLTIKKAIVKHHHDWSKNNKRGFYILYYYGIRNRYLYFIKYKLTFYLIINLFTDIISLPIKIRWSLKVADLKLLKFYYIGLWHGIIGKAGKSEIVF